MTIQHKLGAMKTMVAAICADRDYYKEKCRRQSEVLTTLSGLLVESENISDDIMSLLEDATLSSQSFQYDDSEAPMEEKDVSRRLIEYIAKIKDEDHSKEEVE